MGNHLDNRLPTPESLGTGVDPLDVVERYGADALRYTLITSSGPGNDLRLSEQRVEAGRNFANKLWNAARFVISMIGDGNVRMLAAMPGPDAPLEDRWIVSRVEGLARSVDEQMRKFELGEAARQVYEFVWSEFADWYIEVAKVRARAAGGSAPSPLPVGGNSAALPGRRRQRAAVVGQPLPGDWPAATRDPHRPFRKPARRLAR